MTITLEHKPPTGYIAWPFAAETELGTWPAAVRAARIFVRETLVNWGLGRLADSAVLAASELVTNALNASWPRDATEGVRLWLMSDGHANLVIEVWDGSPDMPEERPADVLAEGGRGLAIVALVSRSWGTYSERHGKVVWSWLCASETA